MTERVTSQLFSKRAFGITIAALVLAPVLAAADVLHSYTPFLFLRLWMIGFAIYGAALAGRAGGARRSWQVGYVLIAIPFVGFWGLDVEIWAVIDWTCAALVGLSALLLRSEPARRGAA